MTTTIRSKIDKILFVFYSKDISSYHRYSTTFDASDATIRKWMRDENYPIKQKHLDRVNALYEAARFWEDKDLGNLSYYTYLVIGPDNNRLSYILHEPQLDIDKIKDHLDMIASIIVAKAKAYEARQLQSDS